MKKLLLTLLLSGMVASAANAESPASAADEQEALKVNITREIAEVVVQHRGQPVTIRREQDTEHAISGEYAKTSRPCPPFCIKPIKLAPGVETIGELEMLAYLQEVSGGDGSIVVIDSRTPDWVSRGTIPGTVNVPWTSLSLDHTSPLEVALFLEDFGAVQRDEFWDYSGAKTLVLFCNGPWCGQSPTNIRTLLALGYPAHKLKWYRGGMHAWQMLGLTTVVIEDSGS